MAQCKYCKGSGFEWQETAQGWRLYKNGERHDCPEWGKRKDLDSVRYKCADIINVLRQSGQEISHKELMAVLDGLRKYKPNKGRPVKEYKFHGNRRIEDHDS